MWGGKEVMYRIKVMATLLLIFQGTLIMCYVVRL